jgi:hypothetical protein
MIFNSHLNQFLTEEQIMKIQLEQLDAVVAVFVDHQDAEAAVRKLADSGFDMTHFSIVGQGYHSEEKVVGFYNTGDRIKFWGKNGAFWGGLWTYRYTQL